MKRDKIEKLLIWLFIFVMPFSVWANNSFIAPVFSKIVNNFHDISLNLEHGELHLTLHHDDHGRSDPEDKIAHGYVMISDSYHIDDLRQHTSNHEFHVESSSIQTIASKINLHTENHETQKLAAMALSASSLDQLTPVATKAPLKTPEVKSEIPGIRTTVLLI